MNWEKEFDRKLKNKWHHEDPMNGNCSAEPEELKQFIKNLLAQKDKEFLKDLEELKMEEMEWDINRSVGQDGWIRGNNKAVEEINKNIENKKKKYEITDK